MTEQMRLYPVVSGEVFRERFGNGRRDWWFIPVARRKWITDYYAFPTQDEADAAYARWTSNPDVEVR